MSKAKLFISFIEALEKREFDKFVIEYLNEGEGFNYVINTDGKDDLGMDVQVLDPKGKNIQFQVTIQKKGFEGKLKEDLVKAVRNVNDFGYSNTLKFFYSQKLTNKKIETLKLFALNNHKIVLDIYEAKRLSGIAEILESLQTILINQNELGEYIDDKILQKDPTINAIHDLLTLGTGADLKIELLKSYIGNFIFENNEVSFEEIKSNVEKHFMQAVDDKFIANTIQKLLTLKKIKKSNIKFRLTEKEQQRVQISRNLLEFRRKQFYRIIKKILSKNGVDDRKGKIQNSIITFFKRHYSNQAKEYRSKDSGLVFREISDQLLSDLKEFTNHATGILIIKELFTELSPNQFIQKICAVNAYTENINIDYLENHLNNIHRTVFLDTQILLQAACYSYNTKSTYKDYFFRETKSLLKFGANQNTNFATIKYYFKELRDQAKMAYNLIPYTKLDFFDSLGTTKNCFFNFWTYQNKNNEIDMTYEDFIKDIGFDFSKSDKVISDDLTILLNSVGISVTHTEKHYIIERTKDLISKILLENNKSKTAFALNNDAIMFEHLADIDTEIHQTTPIFITWDSVLYLTRPKYYEENKLLNRWFMFTPAKFIDHYSITKLIYSDSNITDEMIAFLENRFTTETYNLIDSINTILDLSSETGVKVARTLAEIRDKEIFNKDFLPKEHSNENMIVPVDFVVHKINSFYLMDQDIFDKYKKIFTIEEYIDEIKDIVNESIAKFKETKEFYEGTFLRIDGLIKKV